MNPTRQHLHGAVRLFLPPPLHAHVHDPAQDASDRARALLEHLGHGNLPRTYWNTTRHAAFADACHEEIFQDAAPALNPLAAAGLPLSPPCSVVGADVTVEVAALAWRLAGQPVVTHTAALTRLRRSGPGRPRWRLVAGAVRWPW
ncbi:hypothetical protein [Streptomyces flaveolus]|uniref:hypothetical protein n=1 Tax=Streptomyces flaveolus TaxID=67297 RepID=UPI0036FD8014